MSLLIWYIIYGEFIENNTWIIISEKQSININICRGIKIWRIIYVEKKFKEMQRITSL